ncbi:MAG: hypothetical protein QOD30_1731, partial [Actinomycetota bacterium]|nr:hypothetical protein [Actinomycetota bacterium]
MSVVSVHIADVGLPKSLGLLRHPRPASIPGLLQANAGVAATFGTTPARPSPGRVGLIAFWQDEVALKQFESTHPLAAKLSGGLVVHARPLRIHGAWPGIGDDVTTRRTVEHEGPVLVLTLARTKLSRFIPFFRASGPAEKAVVKATGNVFTSALLRPPFMSTVSLWESSEAAMDYAYSGHQAGHPEAIAAGRVKPFHHQQAFIRLAIDELRGSLA